MILPLPRTGPSSRCRLQLTTKVRLSRPSRDAMCSAPSDSGSSVSPSPRNAQTREPDVSSRPRLREIAVVAGLVDRADRPEAHRDRRELPEVRHQARVRVGAQAVAAGLAPEVVELLDAQPALEERARVDPGRGVTLVEDLVAAAALVLALEEVVEADLVQGRRRGVRGEVTADAGELVVGAQDHRHRVPADQPPDAALHLLVAGERRFLLRADGVDVAGLGQRRQADLELARPLEQLVDDESGACLAFLGDDLVERRHPVVGLVRIDVGELVLELIEVHGVGSSRRGGAGRRSSGGLDPQRGLEDVRDKHLAQAGDAGVLALEGVVDSCDAVGIRGGDRARLQRPRRPRGSSPTGWPSLRGTSEHPRR